ncbi:MAG: hypothetical protein KatS3mg026_0265 [Bacteroidia bacterium]|nr:MAG: hypothetical protein KatS3mg026_0265 [Bacteroidia bacterium]
MLVGEALVGREQDDPVELTLTMMRVQVVLVLEDVDVHEQRLAASRRHPEGQLVQVLLLIQREATCFGRSSVEDFYVAVELTE